MKTKSFSSEQIGEWLATFNRFSTKEEYQYQIHTMRCIFEANNDPEFWDEVCEAAKAKLNK